MSDVYEHNPGDHEDPEPGPTWIVGIAGTVLLAVTILGLTAMFWDVTGSARQERVVDQPVAALEQLEAEQAERLMAGPHRESRVELAEGEEALVIPIDRAIELYAREASTANQ
ncbi:MAG: hypothetical protein GY715_03830 [Planctomycetes bacterium]|nr:hypothetical protein [Planctomycetota bacterium]